MSIDILTVHGFGKVLTERILEFYSNNKLYLMESLKENPYCLIDVQGIALKKVDKLAQAMGIKKTDKRRTQAVIKIVLSRNTVSGNTYLPVHIIKKQTKKDVPASVGKGNNIVVVIAEMIASGMLVLDGDKSSIYLKKYYDAEVNVAKKLLERIV